LHIIATVWYGYDNELLSYYCVKTQLCRKGNNRQISRIKY
jgi:hypothetical protein